MKVLFVGDQPSKTNTSPDVAFLGAACEKRLRSWISSLGLNWYVDCIFVNQSDRLRFQSLVDVAVRNKWAIVAIGKVATYQLGGVKHFTLPHPSGRNRQLNDKSFAQRRLEACKQYLDNHPS